jgi:carboxyl-terminal processing protease
MKIRTTFAFSLIVLGLVTALAGPSPASQAAHKAIDTRDTEANVTRLATDILGHAQFAHRPLDAELAGRFLDRYLDALDGTRTMFLQSDVDEFAPYRTTLAQATLATGDTGAARAIFSRYLQRLEQQVAYVDALLRTDEFDFSGHDVYSFDRERAQRPADLATAQRLWRQQLRSEYLQEKLADKPLVQIVSTLTRRHAQQLRTMKGLRADEVLEIYLDTLAHVYDPHSDYLGHEEMANLSIAMNLSLFGIGASLDAEDGYCKIRDLMPGGPALRSGLLQPGDRIVAVAQAGQPAVDIVNMPLPRAVELIRGTKGSTVTLTVIPGGPVASAAPRTISLVRDEIRLEDQEAKARILDMPAVKAQALRLGVIDLPSFYANMGLESGAPRRSATADVARLLDKLKAEKVQGIVVDLRHNGGGSLDEAISLTGLFIRKGPVVQTRDPSGTIEVGTDDDAKVLYDGPLILLTSRFSASATEILAGALQDYGRAIVVGDSSTFGKGTVQSLIGLSPLMDRAGLAHAYDPGALKVTISKFYRPSGASTQLRGVASDIVLPSTTDFSDVSESALKNPLPWDVVPAAEYERLNRVQPYLEALRDGSSRRVKSREDFAYLAAEIDQLTKKLAAKSVSLNEAERRAELDRAKARREAHERQDRALHVARAIVYPITLQNVDRRGLPPSIDPAKGLVRLSAQGSASGKNGHSSTDADSGDDPVLDESVRILSDYVELFDPRTPATSLGAL